MSRSLAIRAWGRSGGPGAVARAAVGASDLMVCSPLPELIERFTVRPCPPMEATGEDELILVPFGSDLARGFQLARERLSAGVAVRLVGTGATLSDTWPSWVGTSTRLALTELWAYRPRSSIEATEALRRIVESWLTDVFGDLVGELRASEVFFGSACLRVFQPVFVALPDALGVSTASAGKVVRVSDPRWPGLDILRRLVAARGGRVEPGPKRSPLRALRFALGTVGIGSAALAATVLDQIGQYVRSRSSRRRLRESRRARHGAGPEIWTVLLTDWARYNVPLTDAVALPTLDRGATLGVLLHSTLVPGVRNDRNMRASVRGASWSGLERIEHGLHRCILDQIVGPETLAELATTLVRSSVRSTRLLARVVAGHRVVGDGPIRIDLAASLTELAKLVTIDVARATAAELATSRLVRRHDMRGARVVFAASNLCDAVIADLLLQKAGATTIDLAHGSIGTGEPGARYSRSSIACVWSHADARVNAPLGRRVEVAGMPCRARAAPRTGEPRRALFLTNYTHRDYTTDGRLPLEAFQNEVLAASVIAAGAIGPDVELRWRPHPADNPDAIARTLARFPAVAVSSAKYLEEDARWADLIITSMSSSTLEVLLAGVPVFAQVTPDYADTPASSFFDPARTFFRARELRGPLAECVEALRRGDPGALDPERRARIAVFGPSGEPESLEGLLASVAAPGERR